mmetsp:Transcript_4281/g.17682  ORF Transcript_4281/g.17682 Transcript_4281/m.17682 type:complete len:474 (-) Transcript_4281:39-1460(-)
MARRVRLRGVHARDARAAGGERLPETGDGGGVRSLGGGRDGACRLKAEAFEDCREDGDGDLPARVGGMDRSDRAQGPSVGVARGGDRAVDASSVGGVVPRVVRALRRVARGSIGGGEGARRVAIQIAFPVLPTMDRVRVAARKAGDDARSDRREVGATEGRGGVRPMGRGGGGASTASPAARQSSRQGGSKYSLQSLRRVAFGLWPVPNRANHLKPRRQSGAGDRMAHVAGARGRREARAFSRRSRRRDGVQALASASSEGFPGVASGAPVGWVRQPARAKEPRAHDGQEPPGLHPTLDRGGGREKGERGGAAAVPGSEAGGAAVVPQVVLGCLRLGHTERAREHTGQHGERDGRRLFALEDGRVPPIRHTRRAAVAARQRPQRRRRGCVHVGRDDHRRTGRGLLRLSLLRRLPRRPGRRRGETVRAWATDQHRQGYGREDGAGDARERGRRQGEARGGSGASRRGQLGGRGR